MNYMDTECRHEKNTFELKAKATVADRVKNIAISLRIYSLQAVFWCDRPAGAASY